MPDQEKPDSFDLFGNPIYSTKGKKGRPPFQWTKENSLKVSMLLAIGWTNSRIANCILDPRTGLKISEPTLKRHFRSELSERDAMADRVDARRLERLWEASEGGNIGAERLFGQVLENMKLVAVTGRLNAAQQKAKAKKQEAPGKKAQAQLDAHGVLEDGDGDWGDDLTPGSGMH